jgi:hypothetical protein
VGYYRDVRTCLIFLILQSSTIFVFVVANFLLNGAPEVYTYAPGEAFFLVALSVRQISYLSGLCNPGALVDE